MFDDRVDNIDNKATIFVKFAIDFVLQYFEVFEVLFVYKFFDCARKFAEIIAVGEEFSQRNAFFVVVVEFFFEIQKLCFIQFCYYNSVFFVWVCKFFAENIGYKTNNKKSIFFDFGYIVCVFAKNIVYCF